jgi:hypothetical protein
VRTRDWATVDFYAELGVEPTASTDAIAAAFRGLAKRLHPDRPESSADDAARFTAVIAAYEVLGHERLRHAYDEVRLSAAARVRPASAPVAGVATPAPVAGPRPAVDPRIARRNARRWLAAGVAVFVTGVIVAVLVVRLQAHDRARRAGRMRVEATVVPTGRHDDVRFTTATGTVVEVREPNRIDPGTGTRLTLLYRPADPRDVIVDESATARDITLWIVAVKLLVGGIVFFVVGLRGRRRLGRLQRSSGGVVGSGSTARRPVVGREGSQ